MQQKLNIQRTKADTEEFSPRVLKSYLFAQGMNFPEGYRLNKRYVYDYEIELIIDSNGSELIEDTIYPVKKGDLVLRKPGQLTQGIMPYNCYFICFDLLNITGKNPESYDFDKEQAYQDYYENDILNALPTIYSTASPEKYHDLFETVLKEYITPGNSSALIMKSCVLRILYELHKDSRNPFANANMQHSYHYPVIKKIIGYIQNNIAERLDLEVLSELSGLSPNYFHRVFTETLGITPNEYVTKIRLDKARELLAKTADPVSEVAFMCGYENIPYFSYLFKKNLGISPGEFRKRHSYMSM
ncbi:MAG: AraC family transcriptional regulator [Bacillota bacterium]|nr:AraC family transcriptional regulator [Bacillota bacterium]